MYYFVPVPAGAVNPIRLYPTETLARFLTPPPRSADGHGIFDLSAPVGVDLEHDQERGEVVNHAGAWSTPATIDPADDALVLEVGTVLPPMLLAFRAPEPGWRDAVPVPPARPPVVDAFDPAALSRYAASIGGDAQ